MVIYFPAIFRCIGAGMKGAEVDLSGILSFLGT